MDRPSLHTPPFYHASLNFEQLWEEYPPAHAFFQGRHQLPLFEIRLLQHARFQKQIARAWEIPFYQRHWGAVGLERGDIRCLEDLHKIPPYTVEDLRASVERQPPWGDFIGFDPAIDPPMPLVLQTSGGTTGLPRAMIYSPRDREIMNILMGRRLYMQGVRPFDVVQIALSFGLSNGGIAAREGIWKYSGAIPLATGSGVSTPTRRQIEIAQSWSSNFLVAFPAYLRHMALVARDELGIDPHSLNVRGLLTHLGVDDRHTLESLWGADAYDCYGMHECGTIAAECTMKSGMHIFEDAFLVEVLDPETLAKKKNGQRGNVVITSLFKYLAPVIRYNVNDVSAIAVGECDCGSTHRRMERIYGRSDNMVKLRGVNVFPEAVGAVVSRDPRCNGEYVCVVENVGAAGRDEMTVVLEAIDMGSEAAHMAWDLGKAIKEAIGVSVEIDVVGAGMLDSVTGLKSDSKVKRLLDRRKIH